ncbi:MAG: hypothetical protein E5W93_07460 [Mesorhizobium sp.]|nr:MAG: hypothetical protein E5W93_07460 [Mesorhizobium sp.]
MQLTEDVARRVTEAISRPSWKSADPILFAMLLQKNADQNRKVVRWGIAAAVLSYISYGAFDLFLFPDVADRLILTRLSLGLTFLVLVELVARRGFAITTLHYTAALAIVAGAIGWLLSALGTAQQAARIFSSISGYGFRRSRPRP